MLDFDNLGKYTENNRIEAKQALGGLPKSIWETYSSFANTLGGVILLGVAETDDKTFAPVKLFAPSQLVHEFWEILNSGKKVNTNILSSSNVYIKTVRDCPVVVIEVPQASRADRPIYIDSDPYTGTYRRNGEGDYRCTPQEVNAMIRDAAKISHDMECTTYGIDALDPASIAGYHAMVVKSNPGDNFDRMDYDDFLVQIGAAVRHHDSLRATVGGILMFGTYNCIHSIFPHLRLSYNNRLVKVNIFKFYCRCYDSLVAGRDARLHQPLKEALANTLINADYYLEVPISIKSTHDLVTFSNPGSFRIKVSKAKLGGTSDPRNVSVARMFNLINISQGIGSGLSYIFTRWAHLGYAPPSITEDFSPDTTTLALPLTAESAYPSSHHIGIQKSSIIDYVTTHITTDTASVAKLLGISHKEADYLLNGLVLEGILSVNSNGRYELTI